MLFLLLRASPLRLRRAQATVRSNYLHLPVSSRPFSVSREQVVSTRQRAEGMVTAGSDTGLSDWALKCGVDHAWKLRTMLLHTNCFIARLAGVYFCVHLYRAPQSKIFSISRSVRSVFVCFAPIAQHPLSNLITSEITIWPSGLELQQLRF